MDTPNFEPLVTASPSVSRTPSFADKFSKLKSRFMMVFWVVFFLVLIKFSFNFLSSIYSITQSSTSYFSIEVKDDKAIYTRTTTMPTNWFPLSKISKRVQAAIVASEDGKFYLHPGYDLEQLQDAIHHTFVLRKKMRGASTITQQLVKNLYLSKGKTFGRKGSELVMSLMIERYASKQKILEMYLNVIEYGKGLYGIGAASKYYFNKTPAQINAREAAFLAMLLPSPVKYAKSFKNKSLTKFAERIVNSVLLKMRQGGNIGEDEYLNQLEGRFAWEKAPAQDIAKENLVSEEDLSIGSGEDDAE